MTTIAVVLLVGCALVGMVLTGLIRRYALQKDGMIDHPSDRGSHTSPTPRGGGLSIVIVLTAALALGVAGNLIPAGLAIGLIGGGLPVAMIGFLDDHGHVSPVVRLGVHALGAVWTIIWIGVLPLELVPFWDGRLMPVAIVITFFFLVWMINLFNFMDGIDGIAASETISVSVLGAMVAVLAGSATPETVFAPLLLAAATMGFLSWNWPPARIFMGDVGSGYLGIILGGLTIAAAHVRPELGFAWIVLAGVFVTDASVTLARRALRGERVHEAHRTHGYQRLARIAGRHSPVTLGAISVTWLWLFPVACCIAAKQVDAWIGVAIAYVPLVGAAILLGSGSIEKTIRGAL